MVSALMISRWQILRCSCCVLDCDAITTQSGRGGTLLEDIAAGQLLGPMVALPAEALKLAAVESKVMWFVSCK